MHAHEVAGLRSPLDSRQTEFERKTSTPAPCAFVPASSDIPCTHAANTGAHGQLMQTLRLYCERLVGVTRRWAIVPHQWERNIMHGST